MSRPESAPRPGAWGEEPEGPTAYESQQILQALIEALARERRLAATVRTVKAERDAALARVERLRNEIGEYLLWEPGRKGHAAAHHRLSAVLHQDALPA